MGEGLTPGINLTGLGLENLTIGARQVQSPQVRSLAPGLLVDIVFAAVAHQVDLAVSTLTELLAWGLPLNAKAAQDVIGAVSGFGMQGVDVLQQLLALDAGLATSGHVGLKLLDLGWWQTRRLEQIGEHLARSLHLVALEEQVFEGPGVLELHLLVRLGGVHEPNDTALAVQIAAQRQQNVLGLLCPRASECLQA